MAETKAIERHESRIAELAQRLKADSARFAEPGDRVEPQGLRSPAPAPATPVPAPAAPASAQGSAHAPGRPQSRSALDQAVTSAVAAALAQGRGDDPRPIPSKPNPHAEQDRDMPISEPEMPRAFIPPQPERPASRPPRMPAYEEFPLPGQNELRARRGELPDAEHPERRRLTLLQRLAAVGLGRREGEEETKPETRAADPARVPDRPTSRPLPRGSESRTPEPVSEFAKRPAPQGLDSHGRAAPVHSASEDDQLDIPAFLRRQAN